MKKEKLRELCEKFDPNDREAFVVIIKKFTETDQAFQKKVADKVYELRSRGQLSRWANGHSSPLKITRMAIVKVILIQLKSSS